MEEQLLDTWRIHNRINLYLLGSIAPESLGNVSASKGRTVGEQFAHMHNVRLMWLKSAMPELLANLEKVEKEVAMDKGVLSDSLARSAEAIEQLLSRSMGGTIRGFKPHAVAFLGYLISHESHHRGQIALSLKQSGNALEKKVAYGIWEWGVR